MSFDFAKFSNLSTEVQSTLGEKKEVEVLKEIAQEIKKEETMAIPKFDVDPSQFHKTPSLPSIDIDFNVKVATPEAMASDIPSLNLPEDEEDTDIDEDTEQVESKDKKGKGKAKPKETKPAPKKEAKPMKFNGARKVIVYGNELYLENDADKSLEGIRNDLVTQYGFSEFANKDQCRMKFDAKTGEVYPEIMFEKKG
jgi:hypothetical protein